MSTYEPQFYIEQYLRLRWYDPQTGITSTGGGIGTDMWFSNREIKGSITEFERYSPEVYNTLEGYAGYQTRPNNRRWEFQINNYTPGTMYKFQAILQYIQLGYYMDAYISSGYQQFDAENVLVNGTATLSRAVLQFEQMAWRDIKRGLGTVRHKPINFSIIESKELSLPTTGGGGTSGTGTGTN